MNEEYDEKREAAPVDGSLHSAAADSEQSDIDAYDGAAPGENGREGDVRCLGPEDGGVSDGTMETGGGASILQSSLAESKEGAAWQKENALYADEAGRGPNHQGSSPAKPQEAVKEARVQPTGDMNPWGEYIRPRREYAAVPGEKREKGRGRFSRILAVILAAIIFGGGAGIIGGRLSYNYLSASTEGRAVNIIQAAERESEDAAVTNSSGGTVLTGQDIYALGCKQVVGVNIEMKSGGMFGMETMAVVSGSGIIISQDGYILTNYHVVEEASESGSTITVSFNDGTVYEAALVGYESDNSDVAVIKIDAADLDAATIGNSNNMEVGETIYAIGNPLGELTYTVTSGVVSAMDRAITFEDSYGTVTINMFQIDAAVNPGNSGGPVYNERGEIIGLVTAKYDSSAVDYEFSVEGIGFAIPINDAIDIAKDLIEFGYVAGKPSLDIEVRTISSTEAEYYNLVAGAYIATVFEGGAADKAGLEAGDIITKLGDADVTSYSDLNSAMKPYTAGDTAVVTVYHNGEYLEVEVTFDERTASSAPSEAEDEPATTSDDWFSW